MNLFKELSTLDIVLFLLAMCSTAIITIFSNIKKNDSKIQYFLMGRKLTLPLFIATLTSSWYSGVFRVVQLAYNEGFYNFAVTQSIWYLCYILFIFYGLPKIRTFSCLNLAQIIAQIFGQKAYNIAKYVIAVRTMPVICIMSITSLSKLFFPIDTIEAMLVSTIFVLLYTLRGGLSSVVISDMVQFILMMFSVIVVVLFSYIKHGNILKTVDTIPMHFELIGNNEISDLIAISLIAILCVFGSALFAQRCLAAYNHQTAKYGILISIFFWFVFDIFLIIGTLYARIYHDLDAEHGYFKYAIDILPSGIRGLFIAGLASIILSTLDTLLFISSSTLTADLKYQKNGTINKIVMISIAALSIAVAYNIGIEKRIDKIWYFMKSYAVIIVSLPVCIGLFFKNQKINHIHYFSIIIPGAIAMLLRDIYFPELKLGRLYVGCIASTTSFIITSLLFSNKLSRS